MKRQSFSRREFLNGLTQGLAGASLGVYLLPRERQALAQGNSSAANQCFVPEPISTQNDFSEFAPVPVIYLAGDRLVEVKANEEVNTLSENPGTLQTLVLHFPGLKQKPEAFVEKAHVQIEGSDLQTFYFTAADKQYNGDVPYLVLSQVAGLTQESNIQLKLQICKKNGDKIERISQLRVFRLNLKPNQSQFSQLQVPNAADFEAAAQQLGALPAHQRSGPFQYLSGIGINSESKPLNGKAYAITTQAFTPAGSPGFNLDARFVELDLKTGNFAIDIDLMHPDFDSTHYCKWFFVTCPVGRILGVSSRSYLQLPDVARAPGQLGAMRVQSLFEKNPDPKIYKPETIPHIADCPFVHIFCYNGKNCLAKTTVRMV